MRPEEEIKEEIERLESLEPRIRPFSAFGDDNRAKVRAEIKVLREDMSEDDIYALEDLVDYDTIASMLHARYWLNGEEDEAPSAGWQILVIDPEPE